jgi:hypothetical protein
VVADHTTDRGAGEAVMVDVMAGDAAHDRTLDAAFGGCGAGLGRQCKGADGDNGQKCFHVASHVAMRRFCSSRQQARADFVPRSRLWPRGGGPGLTERLARILIAAAK